MIKTIKLSDVFYEAADRINNSNVTPDYTCVAVRSVLSDIFDKTGWIPSNLYHYCFSNKKDHKQQKSESNDLEDKAFWYVMDFIYEMGLKTGPHGGGFNNKNKNVQGARFMWLEFLALAAEDENFVLEFHSGQNTFAGKYLEKFIVKRNNETVATYTN